MKIVYLIRHGQTEDNKNRIIQGQSDSSLTPEGITSTKKKAIKLKEIAFDAIYCSPLGRTRSSMEIIIKELNEAKRVIYLNEIMEIDFGQYAKKNIEECKDIIHDHKNNTWKPYSGGESGDIFKERVMGFMERFVLQNDGRCFLVLTHYGVIETILRHYVNLPYKNIRSNQDAIICLSFNQKNGKVSYLI